MRGISCVAYDILASQKGLCSMELVNGNVTQKLCEVQVIAGELHHNILCHLDLFVMKATPIYSEPLAPSSSLTVVLRDCLVC
jgi:hypothetical protein